MAVGANEGSERREAVDALLDGLEKSMFPEERVQIMASLAEIGDTRAVRPIVRAMERLVTTTQWEAGSRALKRFGTAAVPALVEALADPADHQSIGYLLGVLAEIGGPEALPIAERCLRSERYVPREAAAKALGRLRDPSVVPALCAALDRETAHNCGLAILAALTAIGDRRAVPHLVRVAADPASPWRIAALRAIGAARDPAAIPDLLGWLGSGGVVKDRVDAAIVDALVPIGPEAIPALSASLRGLPADAAAAVARAIGRIGEASAEGALREAFATASEPRLRRSLAGALAACGGDAPETDAASPFLHLVDARRWDDLVALGERAVDALVEATEDPEAEIRGGALGALGRIGGPRAHAIALRALTDAARHPMDRKKAAESLGEMGRTVAEPARGEAARALIETCEASRDAILRKTCVESLGRLGDGTAAAFLGRALAEDPEPYVAQVAARSLAALGTPDARRALAAALDHPSADVRAEVTAALEASGWAPSSPEASARFALARGRPGEAALAGAVPYLVARLSRAKEARRTHEDHAKDRQATARALAAVGDAGALAAILDWLFAPALVLVDSPAEADDWARALAPLLGEIARDVVLAACCLERTERTEGPTTHHVTTSAAGDEAVTRLCAVATPVATEVLRRIAERQGTSQVVWEYPDYHTQFEIYGFERQKEVARAELARRGSAEAGPPRS